MIARVALITKLRRRRLMLVAAGAIILVGTAYYVASLTDSVSYIVDHAERPPVQFDVAIDSIRRGDVFRIVLQPDAYSTGEQRWVEYADGSGRPTRARVRGVDALLFGEVLGENVPIAREDGSIGIDESQLRDLLIEVRAVNQTARIPIKVVDDRAWWAQGNPLPYHENVIIP